MSPLIARLERSMNRAFSGRPGRPSRLLFVVPLTLLLSGCLAQHADVKRLQGKLGDKIETLDQRDQSLADQLARVRAGMERQQKHAEHLFRVARARSKQDVRELRDQELARLHGQLEEANAALAESRQRIDTLQHRLAGLTEALATHQREVAGRLAAAGQVPPEALAPLRTQQESLRRELAAVEQQVRTELDQLFTYVEAFRPTLEELLKKVDRRLQAQDEAIAVNAAATEALRMYLTEFRAALAGAIPTLELPAGEVPGGLTTAPSTTDGAPAGPR